VSFELSYVIDWLVNVNGCLLLHKLFNSDCYSDLLLFKQPPEDRQIDSTTAVSSVGQH